MTTNKIRERQVKANVKFELAAQIRQLLDDAKKAYGPDWADDDVESGVIDLLCDE